MEIEFRGQLSKLLEQLGFETPEKLMRKAKMEILDHGAKRQRAEVRRKVGERFVTDQVAQAEKRKGEALTRSEQRDVSEKARTVLEQRQFHKDH